MAVPLSTGEVRDWASRVRGFSSEFTKCVHVYSSFTIFLKNISELSKSGIHSRYMPRLEGTNCYVPVYFNQK